MREAVRHHLLTLDCNRQVEALRRLYTALMVDGVSLKDKLDRIDNAAYAAFVRLLDPSLHGDEDEYRVKVAYFDKLVASVAVESLSRPSLG